MEVLFCSPWPLVEKRHERTMGFHFHDCFKKCFDGGDPTMRGILKPFGAPVTRRRGDAADGATRSPLKGGVGP